MLKDVKAQVIWIVLSETISAKIASSTGQRKDGGEFVDEVCKEIQATHDWTRAEILEVWVIGLLSFVSRERDGE